MDTLSLAATDRRMRNAISDAAVRIFMLKIKKSRFENEMEFAKLIAEGKKDKMRYVLDRQLLSICSLIRSGGRSIGRHLVLWTRLRTVFNPRDDGLRTA